MKSVSITESYPYRHYLLNVSEVVGREVLLFVLPDFAVASGYGETDGSEAVLVVHPVERLGQFHALFPSRHGVEQNVMAATGDYV